MVGDVMGVEGTEPLDGPGSEMRPQCGAVRRDDHGHQCLQRRRLRTRACLGGPHSRTPQWPSRWNPQADLLRAAALRSLLATGAHLAKEGPSGTPAHAQTELAYVGTAQTERPDDPHINDQLFSGGRLLPPSGSWTVTGVPCDTQLTVYLTPWPRINEAIRQFGHAYDVIARGQ